MNAIVEVETARVSLKVNDVAITALSHVYPEVKTPVVSTSTLRIPSIAGCSISAVAPDYTFEGGLAKAGA